MDIEFLTNTDAPPPPPTAVYSHAVRSGEFLFVTGQLGVDPETGTLVPGGAAEQTRQIMRNLETVLRGAGTSLERAVMVRIYLVNFAADYPVVNATAGSRFFTEFGIELSTLRPTRRHFCRLCLDWTERRPHIAGAVGAAITRRYFDLGWMERMKRSHAVLVTPLGRRGFHKMFGIDASAVTAGNARRAAEEVR